MYKFLGLIVISAVAVSAHPAIDPGGVQTPKDFDAQADAVTKNVEMTLNGGEGSDLNESENICIGYGRGYGYGGYGGYGYGVWEGNR